MNEILKYGNICLRALEPEDVDLLYQWENDTSLWELSNTVMPFSKFLLQKYIDESIRDIYDTKQLRLIIQTTEGISVGAIDLFDFEPYHRRAGIGILIHKTEERGKGYASDALQALCNYASNVLGIHQLYANITTDNTASLGLFQSAGFKISGTKKEWLKTLTGWKDEYLVQKFL